jgi:DNA ligase (NAD+)
MNPVTVLKIKIKEANSSYRNGNPIMSDEDFDYLLEELESEMNAEDFLEFRKSLTEESGDVKHTYIIGSLNKIRYGMNELSKWLDKVDLNIIFWSYKLDGMSFVAKYEEGYLIQLTSRGDGITGQNLTNKAKYINIPNTLSHNFSGEVRGELTLDGDSHIELGFKNRRNGVVGVMGRDNIIPETLKHVQAYAYQIITSDNTIEQQFNQLEDLGFTVPYCGVIDVDNCEEELKSILSCETPYDKDGLVISSPYYKNENVFLPENQVAFKVNSEGVETTITGITWEISKNYLLKPVAQIIPVDIDGATITNVTCYNYKYVKDNNLQIGTKVKIIRAGQVIPRIIEVIGS